MKSISKLSRNIKFIPHALPHCKCGRPGQRMDRYDAYFCPRCNKWLERKCRARRDSECSFCKDRPRRPPQTEWPGYSTIWISKEDRKRALSIMVISGPVAWAKQDGRYHIPHRTLMVLKHRQIGFKVLALK